MTNIYSIADSHIFSNIKIYLVAKIKFSGVILGESFSWKHHVERVWMEISKPNGIMERISSLASESCPVDIVLWLYLYLFIILQFGLGQYLSIGPP